MLYKNYSIFFFFHCGSGRNERGQLGTGDMIRKDSPLLVEELKEHKVVGASCGRSHTLFLTGLLV